MSACQRSGAVYERTGIGTTSTSAPGGSRSAVNAAVQPAGTGEALAAGSGRGTSGRIAIAAAAAMSARRAGQRLRAASRPKASSAAAAPSAMMENRSGITAAATGRACSQCHGSAMPSCSRPPASRVPPSESADSSPNVTALARTGRRRQKSAAMTSEGGEHRPAEIAQVLGQTALEPGRERGAAGRVRQHGGRRLDEAGQVVLVVVGRERAAALAERAEELHPQRIARDRSGHRDPGADADRDVPDPAGYRGRPGCGHHHGEDHRGHGRVKQQFLGDEELGGRQQAEPDAAAGRGPPAGAAAPGRQPQRGVDDQRREDRELQIVVARRRTGSAPGRIRRQARPGRRRRRWRPTGARRRTC